MFNEVHREYLRDMKIAALKEVKKELTELKNVVFGRKSKNDITTIRLTDDEGNDIRGLNDAFLRYDRDNKTGERTKVNEKNYTEEAEAIFSKMVTEIAEKSAPTPG